MIKDLEKEVIENEVVEEEVNKEVEKNELVDEKPTENIQNIDFSVFNKRKFSINGDPSKIIELDPSDLMIISRIKDEYPKLEKLQDKIASLSEKTKNLEDTELIDEIGSQFREIDNKMRECVNTIFDYDVCSVCVPTGSLYDAVNGKFKYEHLIETLIRLYDENLTKEYKKIQSRVAKHTSKYVKR